MMLTIGYLVTKQQMLDEVEFILKLDGCETPFTMTWPGKSWYQCFANEHKDVMVRIAQGVSKPQVDVMKEELEHWFYGCTEYLGTVPGGIQALADPKCIWNVDESRFALDGLQGAL